VPPQDRYVALARAAITTYLGKGQRISVPSHTPPELIHQRKGAFVSLKRGTELRGCIGTYLPTQTNLAEEIIENAILAATQDPRFPPVKLEELPHLRITVDVLSTPEPCQEMDLDPKRYGVIVESGWRRGLLLPDLPGVDTPQEQLRIAKVKAGLLPHEPCRLLRFTVERHQG